MPDITPEIQVEGSPIESEAIYLYSPTDLKLAVTLGQADRPTEINGQPVKYFWASGIKIGNYTHPVKGFNLDVDRKRIDGWIENFRRMRASNVDVPACADHSEKARDALGYVVDMRRDGDTLKVLHQMIGEDAIRMASRNKISLGIHKKFKDGLGTVYGESIIHSALTPVPVVPAQDGLIAASRGQQSDPVILALAASRSTAMPFTATQLDEIRKLPGAGEISEDDAAAWLLSYANSAVTEDEIIRLGIWVPGPNAEWKTVSEATPAWHSHAAETHSRLSKAATAEGDHDMAAHHAAFAKAHKLAAKGDMKGAGRTVAKHLSMEDDEVPGPRELHFLSMSIETAEKQAVEAGAPPYQIDAARKKYLGDVDTSTITLSRKQGEDDGHLSRALTAYGDFLELAKLNKPARGSNVNPANVVELARTAGDDSSVSADRRKQLLSQSALGNDLLATK